jgi:hypothetical protein
MSEPNFGGVIENIGQMCVTCAVVTGVLGMMLVFIGWGLGKVLK